MHYLNNAAHRWPKPQSVYQALDEAYKQDYTCKSGSADIVIETAQQELSRLLKIPEPSGLQFTSGCTEALQRAFQCIDWQPGDGVVVSAVEHQSMMDIVLGLARTRGVQLYIIPYAFDVPFDLAECETLLQTHPQIRLIATPHASNVIGCVLPVKAIAALAHRYGKLFLLDAAQTAGLFSINVQRDGIDLLAFPGRKGLGGPRGVGALYIGENVPRCSAYLIPELDSSQLPKIVALTEGVRWAQAIGLQTIRSHTISLLAELQDGLEEIPEVTVYGLSDISQHISVLSFNVLNHHPEVLAQQLFEDFGIVLRAGLHNSRLSHEAIGTIHRGGTIRASLGYHTRPEDIVALITAIKTILVGSLSGAWGVER